MKKIKVNNTYQEQHYRRPFFTSQPKIYMQVHTHVHTYTHTHIHAHTQPHVTTKSNPTTDSQDNDLREWRTQH